MITTQPKPSAWLYTFLRGYEKFRPTAYPATKAEKAKGIWTLGFGHTKCVKEGDTCTLSQAETTLAQDINEKYQQLLPLIKVQLNQNQLDAVLSLAFNTGVGRRDGVKGDIADSTLLHKLNSGDMTGTAAEFHRWNKQDGRVLAGLTTRRAAEAAHFLAAP